VGGYHQDNGDQNRLGLDLLPSVRFDSET
jgi:hypothetical protein